MNRIHQIYDSLRLAGLTEAELKMCIPEVKKRNVSMLNWILLVLMGSLAGLFLVSNIPGTGEASNKGVYFGFMTLVIGEYLAYRLYFLKHQDKIMVIYYLFMFTTYAFGICQAIFVGPECSSAAYCVFLVAVPIVVVDLPIRLTALTLGVESILLIAYFLIGSQAVGDRFVVINSLTSTGLGIGCGISVQRTKFSEIRNQLMVEKQRDTDMMTGALSRVAFNRDMEQLCTEDISAGVVYVDVNGLKTVNDTSGHASGDCLIKETYDLIVKYFNRSGDRIYRIGGDEFVIFSTDVSEEAFRRQYKEMTEKDEKCYILSSGCIWLEKMQDMQSAILCAEKQMYAEKESYYRLHPEGDRRMKMQFDHRK